MSNVELVGVNDAIGKIGGLSENANKMAKQAVFEVASQVFKESQRLVPVRYGVLRASGKQHKPKQEGKSVTVEITYGGAAAGYALYVHEDLTAYHRPPTQAKYLEQPTLEIGPNIGKLVEQRIKQILGGR